MLEAQGVDVIMTRASDDGVGPCVDQRAAIGNNANADVVVSIHGDGVDNHSTTGFYVMTSEREPAGAAMAAQSDSSGRRPCGTGWSSAGLSPSNYLGSNGLWDRGRPGRVEPVHPADGDGGIGQHARPSDAALMSSDAGQQKFAQGYANGILAYLQSLNS